MKSRTSLFVCLVLSGTLCTQGCSFMFVKGPPADAQARIDSGQTTRIECTESAAWPVIDGLWAALNGLGAVSAMSEDEGAMPNRDQVIAVGLGWLALSGASAIYGATKVSQCKKARGEQFRRLASPADLVPLPTQTASADEPEPLRMPPFSPASLRPSR